MKRTRVMILLCLILALIFFDLKGSGSDATSAGDGGKVWKHQSAQQSDRSADKWHTTATKSQRISGEVNRYQAHLVNVDDGESVFLRGRKLETDISEVINLYAELVVLDDGREVTRLLRRVIHLSDQAVLGTSLDDLFEGGKDEFMSDTQGVKHLFRAWSQSKGNDIMAMEVLLIEPGKPFEAVVAPGEEELLIDGVAVRGRDGKLRLKFGRLYEAGE